MGDRFIPIRNVSNEFNFSFQSFKECVLSHGSNLRRKTSGTIQRQFMELLSMELFGSQASRSRAFYYGEDKRKIEKKMLDTPDRKSYSLSPISPQSQDMLRQPQKPKRAFPKTPYKILDAPYLKNDFYLNLLDWGQSNVLAVGLASSIYLWSAASGKVVQLHDFGATNHVTSVLWTGKGTQLAVGTDSGVIYIWDIESTKSVRSLKGHSERVAALAWNDNTLTSGGKDEVILHHDLRAPGCCAEMMKVHEQEICGLQWDRSLGQLASGGNDNNLFVWDYRSSRPLHKFEEHTAAVKAIGWSPHQRGILASGGGTIDRCLTIHNTLTGRLQNKLDTGSQVCNMAWSKTSNEIVTTHGFAKNQVSLWKYPSLKNIANLTAHTNRVLYLSMSPDGQSIVTGAGDETLRFWKLFNKKPKEESTLIR
ncbi:meiotic APC activator Mfr1 [Schizosaccharomyces pombe]|uniref:Meiotic fizzy-related protein 1 n=1 Tax=Schizosaccharomyces pombe (strain 972 / ATCC 24843) TaxID=284812 RepID=MFR1_SCHPO|nr:Fzy-like protein Mfr1 [Schizosaccharomyces pombe]O94423.1 RecName: Full=Meiotic fizzy-related protein 1 [Schizosaccharomyces pombe 972h-]CAB91187.1 fizzy-related protein Mfr1 [Schizosaccharomyces pombe]|eukprot:NP_595081.1 Fzy-like protein Mfr1 [Schizosaccharomyces pombe]